jgi:N-dimethylarginine dimethylaminohydrolase
MNGDQRDDVPADDTKNDDARTMANVLTRFPFYEEGKVPQYHRYHAEVSYLDELTLIWGKPWGAQGIGRLREVAMVQPTATEVRKLYEQDSAFFVFNGVTPDLELMRAQHRSLATLYESLGITVHYVTWPDDPPKSGLRPDEAQHLRRRGLRHQRRRDHSARSHAVLARPSRYVAQFLMQLGCPILYTVHGHGVCEIGASVRMSDDFIVLMLSTDCNRDGAEQVLPILHRAGYKEVLLASSPGPLYSYHDEVPGWMHADMWIMPLDRRLALIYPPWCDYETIRALHAFGYELLEAPRDEVDLYPVNGITIEPRRVIMNASAVKTRALLERHGVEVIPIEYGEVHKYGGGIRCNTMQLVRDRGPCTFAA